VGTLFVRSDILLMNYLKYDKAVIGNYVLIITFILLIPLLQEAIFTQLLPKTSRFSCKTDYQKYYTDIKYIRIGAVILSFCYVLFLPFILKLLSSEKYEINMFHIFILGIPYIFGLFNEFNCVLLYAMEKHRYIAMAYFLGLVSIIVVLFSYRNITTLFHVVVATILGKLVMESIIYFKVKECLRTAPD